MLANLEKSSHFEFPVDAPKKSEFVTALHFVRGACAISVAAYHFVSWRYGIQYQSIGTFGVYTFFVLSAVVLLHIHAEEFSSQVTGCDLRRFYKKRFARIMPLLALSALVYLLYYHLRYDVELNGLLQKSLFTATGLFSLHIPGFLSTTTGAWSLAIELWFYLLFPVIALLAASIRFRFLLFAFFLTVLSQQILLSTLPDSRDPLFWQQYTMPLTFVPFFAAGFLIFKTKGKSASGLNFWLCALALGTVFGFSFVTDANVYEAGPIHLFLMAGCALGVWFAYNSVAPICVARISKWAGDISYSVYLWHWLSFEIAKDIDSSLASAAMFALVAILIAHLSWRYFEIPAERVVLRALSPRIPD